MINTSILIESLLGYLHLVPANRHRQNKQTKLNTKWISKNSLFMMTFKKKKWISRTVFIFECHLSKTFQPPLLVSRDLFQMFQAAWASQLQFANSLGGIQIQIWTLKLDQFKTLTDFSENVCVSGTWPKKQMSLNVFGEIWSWILILILVVVFVIFFLVFILGHVEASRRGVRVTEWVLRK